MAPPKWLGLTDNEQTFRTLLCHSQAMYFETDTVMRISLVRVRAPVCGKFRMWEVNMSS